MFYPCPCQITLIFQAKVCGSRGFDCSRRQKIDKSRCKIPCEGIYADFWKEDVDIVDGSTPGMANIIKAYEKYKNQFSNLTIKPPGRYNIIFYLMY